MISFQWMLSRIRMFFSLKLSAPKGQNYSSLEGVRFRRVMKKKRKKKIWRQTYWHPIALEEDGKYTKIFSVEYVIVVFGRWGCTIKLFYTVHKMYASNFHVKLHQIFGKNSNQKSPSMFIKKEQKYPNLGLERRKKSI